MGEGELESGESNFTYWPSCAVLIRSRSLFRHKHEIETGRTSSVGLELLGFAPTGEEITQEAHFAKTSTAPAAAPTIGEDGLEMRSRRQALSWEEISGKAHKIISFTDLAGHERCVNLGLSRLRVLNAFVVSQISQNDFIRFDRYSA